MGLSVFCGGHSTSCSEVKTDRNEVQFRKGHSRGRSQGSSQWSGVNTDKREQYIYFLFCFWQYSNTYVLKFFWEKSQKNTSNLVTYAERSSKKLFVAPVSKQQLKHTLDVRFNYNRTLHV